MHVSMLRYCCCYRKIEPPLFVCCIWQLLFFYFIWLSLVPYAVLICQWSSKYLVSRHLSLSGATKCHAIKLSIDRLHRQVNGIYGESSLVCSAASSKLRALPVRRVFTRRNQIGSRRTSRSSSLPVNLALHLILKFSQRPGGSGATAHPQVLTL